MQFQRELIFFLFHGYHPKKLEIDEKLRTGNDNFIQKTDGIITKLKQFNDCVQTIMVVAQQEQRRYADKSRTQIPKYKVKDKVWLTLKNITTATENKKLDAKQAKYIIFEDIGFHNFRFDGIRNVFHVDRLRAASMDLFFLISDDNHPGLFIVNEKPPNMTLSASWKKKAGPRLPIFGQMEKLCSFYLGASFSHE